MAAEGKPLPPLDEEQPVVEASPDNPVSPRIRRLRPRSKNRTIIFAVVALAVVAGSVWLWHYLGGYESTDDAQVDVHLAPVSARISGYVIKVNVNDNQYVEKGTVLVEVDPKDYQVAVDKARADLANAEANAQALNISVPVASVNTTSQITSAASDVESANAGVTAAESQLAAAQAQVLQSEANDVKAQDDLKRYKRLVEKQNVSEQTYDQALAEAKASTASVTAARANEAAARQSVQQARSRLTQAQASHKYALTGPQQVATTRARAQAALADVKQKRAVLEQAELNLQYTKVVAPVSGQVNKTVVEGANVQPGQILLNVVPLDDVWITANFKETQLKHMRPGQKVEFEVDSSGRRYQGHVDSIAGATGPLFSALPPENATGNYVKVVQRVPVKIILDPGQNKDRELRPGMSVQPKVYLR